MIVDRRGNPISSEGSEIVKSIGETSDPDAIFNAVAQLKELTAHLPVLAKADAPSGGVNSVGPSRGPKAVFFDPLSLQYSLGYKDRRYSLTYDTLKRVAQQVSILNAIINTRIAQIASFSEPYRFTKSLGFRIKHKSPDHLTTDAERDFIEHLEAFVLCCGEPGRRNPFTRLKRPKFEVFLKKIVRDTLQYDQLGFEIIPRRNKIPFEFWATDASTLRIASPDRDDVTSQFSLHHRNNIGTNFFPHRYGNLYQDRIYGDGPEQGRIVDYVQVVNGQIENVYMDGEMAFGIRNPRSDIYIQGYGYSEIEQLITIITAILYAEEWNRRNFSQGAHPKGLLNFKGDNWTPDQLECVAEDSLVQTDRGTFTIGDAFNIQNTKDVQFRFWNGYSYELGVVSQSGVKPLVEINFDNGTSLRATENHRVFVLTDEGEEERFVADLQPGDLLLQPESVVGDEKFALKDLINTKWEGSRQGEGVDFEIEEIGEDLWEFIGWQVGDGWLSKDLKTLLMFYHGTKDIDAFVKHGETLAKYGISYKEKTVKENMRTWQICHKAFAEFLVEVGIGTGRDKKIPWLVYTQSPEKRAAFLRGLFSADGYVTSNRYSVAITSIYSALLDGIQQLLNTLGLSSYRVKHSKPNATQIYLRRRELYKETIGFCQQYKMDLIAEVKDSARTPFDPVPLPLLRNLLEDHRDYFENNDGHDKELKKAGLSIINKQKAARIKSRLYWKSFLANRGDLSKAELLGYRPIRVVSVEPSTTEMTYDVSILSDAEPKFVVNGVVTHNSFKRQWIAQVAGTENAWKTPITQSEGIEWIQLQNSNQEMGYQGWLEYLIKISCGVFLIDPAEINFDLHGGVQQTPLFESSQEWKLKASRDRGLKPLLRFLASLINEYVIDKIDDHFMFEFAGLDELTEQEKHELLKEQINSYMTLNEGRRELDLPEIPGGIGDLPLNPTLVQLLQMQQQREDQLRQEQQQQEQQQQEQQQQEQQQQEQMQQGPAGQQPQGEPPDPEKEQKVRHAEDKHPLEMQLLQQKVDQASAQGAAAQMAGAVPPETAAQEAVAQQGEAPQEAAPMSQNQQEPAAPDQQAVGPMPRPKGDAKKQYAALFGKSITFDDFIDFMRSR